MSEHVDTFILSDEADKCLYEDLLEKKGAGLIKVYRDEFTFAKNGRETDPIITVWWRDLED